VHASPAWILLQISVIMSVYVADMTSECSAKLQLIVL